MFKRLALLTILISGLLVMTSIAFAQQAPNGGTVTQDNLLGGVLPLVGLSIQPVGSGVGVEGGVNLKAGISVNVPASLTGSLLSLQVRLTAQNNTTATVGTDFTISQPILNIPLGSGNQYREVDITIIDDLEIEATEYLRICLTADAGALLGLVTVQVEIECADFSIQDNDTPTATPAPSQVGFQPHGNVYAESYGEIDLNVVLYVPGLGILPGGVTVGAAVSGTAQNGVDFTIDQSPITFEPGSTNGSVRQLTIDLIDDLEVEADEQIDICLYVQIGLAVVDAFSCTTVIIEDNDTPGVVISAQNLTVTEGQPGVSYTVRLASAPAFDETVTITLGAFDAAQIGAAPAGLTFTRENWNVDQTVTVTAVDDLAVESSPIPTTITHSVSSSRASSPYQGFAASSVAVSVIDNDMPGVMMSSSALTVTEGGDAQTFTMWLTAPPPQGEIITFTPSFDSVQIDVLPSPITFDHSNWNQPRMVMVTAIDDTIVEDSPLSAPISWTASSSNPASPYNALPVPNTDVSVIDNDVAGVIISVLSLTVAEGGPAQSFTMQLAGQPAAGETVTITPSFDAAQIVVLPSPITFDSTNWNQPQTILVSAVDDDLVETSPLNAPISYSMTSSRSVSRFNNAPVDDTPVSVIDNDTLPTATNTATATATNTATATRTQTPTATAVPAVLLSRTEMTITEGQPGVTYNVRLSSPPASGETVTITMSYDRAQMTWSPSTITLTSANWNTGVNMTVTAVDDTIDEESPMVRMPRHNVSSSNPSSPYASMTGPQIRVNIIDNDDPPTATNTATRTATPTNTLVPPTATNTATNTPVPPTATNTATRTATRTNTPIPPTATNTATRTATNTPVPPTATRTATRTNTPIPPTATRTATPMICLVTVNTNVLYMNEADPPKIFAVRLTQSPAANETVTVTHQTDNTEITISPASRVFTPSSWNSWRNFTVSVIDDNEVEPGLMRVPITLILSSNVAGSQFNGMRCTLVVVEIHDNDQP